MQLSDLRAEVRAAGFPSTYATAGGRVDRWINWAYHDILSRFEWSFREAVTTFPTVNGTAAYTLVGTTPVIPDFAGEIEFAVNISSNSTAYIPMASMSQPIFDRISISASAGAPGVYTIRGGTPATTSATIKAGGQQQIVFFPTPDDTYTVRATYFRAADSVELSADADVPIIPIRLQPAIAMLATAHGWRWENGDPRDIAEMRSAAEEMIAHAIQREPRQRRAAEGAIDDAETPAYPPAQPQPARGRAA